MDCNKAPLFESIISHQQRHTSSFHVPGHKSGQGLDPQAKQFLHDVMSIDYTEITGLDDLHQPSGAIKEAQEMAAACFGADETYFLVNGSTVGNLALILSLCSRNDILIVQRNVHKSIIHGLMLAGARAVFLPPRWDDETGLATGVRLEDVEFALLTYPEAKGVMLSNPNYYGMGVNLASMAERVHAYHKPLLVDEAHGAHYGFHPAVPPSALSCGADGVVQSTHKMLTAMTMGAMLHVQGDRLDRRIIRERLSILQSSSPSYPIMLSLDLSRRWMHVRGEAHFSKGWEAVKCFRKKMKNLPHFRLVESPSQSQGYDTMDPFKMVISDATGTFSGYELQRELERLDCMAEMADPRHVLILFSIASKRRDADRLAQAFLHISEQFQLQKKELQGKITNMDITPHFTEVSSPIVFDLQMPGLTGDLPHKPVHMACIEDTVNCLAAEMVIAYPPGIPILYPGEMITTQAIAYLQHLAHSGARFHGVQDTTLQTMRVYA